MLETAWGSAAAAEKQAGACVAEIVEADTVKFRAFEALIQIPSQG